MSRLTNTACSRRRRCDHEPPRLKPRRQADWSQSVDLAITPTEQVRSRLNIVFGPCSALPASRAAVPTDCPFAYFTTVTVTTTLVTSPVIRSAAAVNSVDCPSFKISALLV